MSRWEYTTKLELAKLSGLGPAEIFAPDRSPWENPPYGLAYDRVVGDEEVNVFLEGIEDRGVFDPTLYHADTSDARSIADALKRAYDHGAKTYVVLAPESRRMSARMPREAEDRALAVLRERLGAAAPSVLDFRDSMTDDVSHDPSHMNEDGRVQLTKLVAAGIRSKRTSEPMGKTTASE